MQRLPHPQWFPTGLTNPLFALLLCFSAVICLAQSATVTVRYDAAHPSNVFVPLQALGVAVDGHEHGDNDLMFRPENVRAMLSVGLKPVSYRLRTELGNEAWHWNPAGHWSDTLKKQGYWTSATDTRSFISLSYGYRLPHRGNTIDQANDDGYSRITDGRTKSFWKSNPYLDTYFTREQNGLHPQWVIVDLGTEFPVNALKISWSTPFATSFTVEYGVREVYDYFDNAGYFDVDTPQLWKPFSNSRFTNANGNTQLILLSTGPVKARFLRIRLLESSYTSPKGSTDIRERLGYAIKELYAGRMERGKFIDLLSHKPNAKQSKVYVSSTDPWHRAVDVDSLTEQIGIDRFYQSGLNSGLPVLLSTGLLYDTPENATALLDYVVRKGYPVAGAELGEEPDGQMTNAVDAAALYRQWTHSIKRHHPSIPLGGPSLQGIISNQHGEILPTKKWMDSFTSYLDKKEALKDLQFFSFEWYPYDSACVAPSPQLAQASHRLEKAMADMREIPALKNLPFYITEYSYSAFAGVSEVSIEGALMNADIVGKFLACGGSKAFLYGWEPNILQSDFGCPAGNNMLFGMNDAGKIVYRTATYYGAQLLQRWAQHFDQKVSMHTATTNVQTTAGEELLSAYALHLPDSSWSILLINKSPGTTYSTQINVADKNGETSSLKFPLTVYQYSGAQYQWKSDGLNGHPIRELPPVQKSVRQNETLPLPPYSLTVVRSEK